MGKRKGVRGKLTAKWSKKENDILIDFPTKPDGHYLHQVFNCERYGPDGEMLLPFVKALEERGYDITTLKFQVKRLPCTCPAPLQDIDEDCEVHGRLCSCKKESPAASRVGERLRCIVHK